MNETELKHVIALLLEDAKRLQQLEPNAGTEARIWIAKRALDSDNDDSHEFTCDALKKSIQRLESALKKVRDSASQQESKEILLSELKLIESELK
ncbi:TPA: hypothetical protein L5114_001912 [Escherichia coli]|nr:hypothetical protein [Escherichia coli]